MPGDTGAPPAVAISTFGGELTVFERDAGIARMQPSLERATRRPGNRIERVQLDRIDLAEAAPPGTGCGQPIQGKVGMPHQLGMDGFIDDLQCRSAKAAAQHQVVMSQNAKICGRAELGDIGAAVEPWAALDPTVMAPALAQGIPDVEADTPDRTGDVGLLAQRLAIVAGMLAAADRAGIDAKAAGLGGQFIGETMGGYVVVDDGSRIGGDGLQHRYRLANAGWGFDAANRCWLPWLHGVAQAGPEPIFDGMVQPGSGHVWRELVGREMRRHRWHGLQPAAVDDMADQPVNAVACDLGSAAVLACGVLEHGHQSGHVDVAAMFADIGTSRGSQMLTNMRLVGETGPQCRRQIFEFRGGGKGRRVGLGRQRRLR